MENAAAVTCNSIEGGDAEKSYHSHIDVPAQGLLNEHCPREHVHLQAVTTGKTWKVLSKFCIQCIHQRRLTSSLLSDCGCHIDGTPAAAHKAHTHAYLGEDVKKQGDD